MLKRTLYFTTPARLSTRNGQLVIENHETGELRTVPIEDIGIVIIENQKTSVSTPALNALSNNNCAVVFCDEKHLPNAMLMNLNANSVQAEVLRYQQDAGLPLKKNLWKQIIVAKIRNQSHLLDEFGKNGSVLKPYYANVKSGDADNREGIAAKLYWDKLFGPGFHRDKDGGGVNSMLNYGYTVLRAAMARSIMGSGLFPMFSLYHRNRYNAFPLADDLMEPYRPYVDNIVYLLLEQGVDDLTTQSKQSLLRVLFADTKFEKMTRPLEIGLTLTSASLVKCLKGETKQLSYPDL